MKKEKTYCPVWAGALKKDCELMVCCIKMSIEKYEGKGKVNTPTTFYLLCCYLYRIYNKDDEEELLMKKQILLIG